MTKRYLLLPLGALFIAASALADVSFEASVTGSNTGNLLEDSTSISDSYTTVHGAMSFYPTLRTEIKTGLDYTYYSDLYGLSNLVTNVAFSHLPLRKESRFQVYINGSFSGRIYRDQFRDFSSRNDFVGMASVSYRLSRSTQLRSGVSFNANVYTNSWVADKHSFDFFAGANFTLFERNSLDIEVGINTGNYQYYDRSLDSGVVRTDPEDADDPRYAANLLHDGTTKFFYISPRISRQLAAKTGISVSYQYRSFIDRNENAILYGYSTGLLSPWIEEYEGSVVVLSIKTYLVPKTILTVGAGYWHHKHYETLDWKTDPNPFEPGSTIEVLTTFGGESGHGGAYDRIDNRTRFYLAVQRPIASWQGLYWEPSLRIEFTDNSSNGAIYDYSFWATSISLKTQW